MTHISEKRLAYKFWLGNLKGGGHLEDLGARGREVILK
jgi:hypothetical protein